MVLASAVIQRGDQRRLKIWLFATARGFGMTFIGGQVYEFTEFSRTGLSLGTNLFGSSFYLLTGLHAAYARGHGCCRFGLGRRVGSINIIERIEIAGLYWHFVDVVWIVIFTVVYLIRSRPPT